MTEMEKRQPGTEKHPGNEEATACTEPSTERIALMEQRLDRATAAVEALEAALEHYRSAQEDLAALDAYLGSPEWHADRDADEAGRLPQGLKRGVLSEDAIWNLLERAKELGYKQQL